jgi:hypothetical protein
MDRVLTAARFHVMHPLVILGVPWLVALSSFVINLAVWGVFVGQEPGAVTGGIASLYITVLVVFAQSVSQLLPFAMGLGVSRRTFYAGTAVVAGAQALAYGVVLSALTAVEDATGGWGLGLQFWSPGGVDVDNAALQVLVSGTPVLAAAALGVGSGVVLKRWGTTGVWATVIGSMLALAGLVAITTALDRWADIWSWTLDQSTVTLMVLVPTVVALAIGGLSFVGLRKVVP